HPDVSALGWDRFADLIEKCQIPVFALGGMSPDDLAT
ncbi:dGTP triphosphohydrolase, partial [Acinetobacter baumannii]|nr:dGTP triphosphohydrolase [Acinetobacter baumannii]